MSYKVDFDAIDTVYNSSQAGIQNVSTQLQNAATALQTIIVSQNMSGAGADSIRDYFNGVHGTIIETIEELLSLYSCNFLLYKDDYETNIDTRLHAVIHEDELVSIKDSLQTKREKIEGIDFNVRQALQSVNDIFSTSYRGIDSVLDIYSYADRYLNDLNESIKNLESTHIGTDFTAMENLIDTLKNFINVHMSYERAYKEEFSLDKLASSSSFKNLYSASVSVNKELEDKEKLIETAIDNENDRLQLLQQEYEERQRQATAAKWIVTGICVIGSIAAIALTGGAATPLVVGVVSGVSGAVSSGFNNLADQYVENGTSWSDYDMASCGKDAVIGGVTGFVTGAVGAGVGGAISSGLGNTAIGSTLLNSSNAAVRIGTGAVIGSVSEVGSGIISRGAGTYIATGGDIEAAKESAFDLKSIVVDAATGGVSGGISSAKNPVGKEIELDEIDDELLETKPLNSPDPKKWINEKGGTIYVDGNGTWTYQAADGTHICYTDGYPDFDRAGLVEDTYDTGGFDTRNHNIDIKKAQRATDEGVKGSGKTWHHHQDCTTLELVPTEYHELFRHRAGFSIAKGG